MEPGTHTILHREPHAHRLRDDQDIAEDDRCVHSQPFHRLQRDLDASSGVRTMVRKSACSRTARYSGR